MNLMQDIRYALRTLGKSPMFTVVVVLTLAVGIGANTALFSVVNSVLLRPLPYEDPERLVLLYESVPALGHPKTPVPPADFQDLREGQRVFEGLAAFVNKDFELSRAQHPELVTGAKVSANLFPLLGVNPALGRGFTEEEDQPGNDRVVVLSHGLWQRQFGGDVNIVGKTILLHRQPYSVIGVMPVGFQFPLPGPEYNNEPADLWVPMAFTSTELQIRASMYVNGIIARLKPDIAVDQARAEVDTLARNIQQEHYPTNLL